MKADIFNLWPHGDAPGASQSTAKPQIIDLAKEFEPYNRAASGVRCPELAVWYPEESNGVTLLVAPGGSFARIMIDSEGSALATFFTAMGYTLAVMTYRLPADGHHEGADAPLADAQRAVRVLRDRATRGLNGKRIVMMGFSAGGYVAASLGTRFSEKLYPPQDTIDNLPARPDALVLVYPLITMRDGQTHADARKRLLGEWPDSKTIEAYSLETRVSRETPPVLLIHAVDDESVPVTHSMAFFSALREQKCRWSCIFTNAAATVSVCATLPIRRWQAGRCW